MHLYGKRGESLCVGDVVRVGRRKALSRIIRLQLGTATAPTMVIVEDIGTEYRHLNGYSPSCITRLCPQVAWKPRAR